ncbi:MAG: YdcF family protein [Planctomycetes bacterium]|nr:YdcF family protein [Planctomycetota bacterium]
MHELKYLLLPPLSGLLLAVAGLLVARRKPRLGRLAIAIGLLSLWLFATPFVASRLLDQLQVHAALAPDAVLPADAAVVVLSAGTAGRAPEYGDATVDARTLVRLRYGCRLAKRSGLPLLVTGGPSWSGMPAIAQLMAETARDDFGIAPRWIEPDARNTHENAANSARLLDAAGIHRAVVVTDAFHLPRAIRSFRSFGIDVLPAPTGFVRLAPWSFSSFVPSHKGIADSALGLHEALGLVFQSLFQL